MKRITTCLLAVLLMATVFTACSLQAPAAADQNAQRNENKLHIVATTFPQYDWARQILGDKAADVELTLLLDDGVDLHSYQPTVEDIAKISTCDMFIYVGGESDGWVQGALKAATNQNMIVVNMLEVLGDKVKEEERIEGMEHDHEHDHDEIDPDTIQDRPLADWQGSWTTIETALESGALDAYVEHNAEESGNDFETQKAAYAERWKSDHTSLIITGTSVDFGGAPANYNYIGYKLVETDQGASVWYGFKAADSATGTPLYIAFSDHGIGGEHADEEEHGEEAHEEEHGAAHFHLRYGNESFEALTAVEGWSPTYFPSDAPEEEIAETMSGHSHGDEPESDEHVWLSLKNAQVLCAHIAGELERLDAKNAAIYASNAEAYHVKLAELDAAYQNVVENAAVKTLLFGDRFPFRYLVDDYGLTYYAAFSGCSAETEASFETIVFLANKANELALQNVMVLEGSGQSIAKTVIENTKDKNQKILVLDSMQSITARNVAAGATYLSVMESNLAVLKEALA